MKKILLGILLGAAAGIVDLIPMVLQNLSWDANVSAFTLWVVSGFLTASSDIKTRGYVKGTLISFLVLAPSAVLIGAKEPASLIPIAVMTVILGSLLGYLIEKYGK